VGEIWLPDADRLARYLRPDELHTAFNFDFLGCPWAADRIRGSIDASLAVHEPIGAPPTWVLSNHDVTRPVTRYGRADSSFAFETKRHGVPTDLERGTRRARAAALLTMALPGSMYVYQGEELGLPEVEDIPPERRRDPMWLRSDGNDPGRDGCRVPIPWWGSQPPYGFSPDGAERPWLDQPDDWAPLTVAAQIDDPASMLSLYRGGLRIRRTRPWGAGQFRWLDAGAESLSFARGEAFTCLVNFGPEPVAVPAGAEILIASDELEGGALPQDTTVWLYRENGGVGPSN
jgi:alpha-glucosidase